MFARTTLRFSLVALLLLMGQTVRSEQPAPEKGAAPLERNSPRTDRYGDPLPPGVIARLGANRLRHLGRAFDVAFSPDGKILASVGEDHRIRMWDAATGRLLRALPGHPAWVRFIAFSPTGKMLASVGNDNTVRLWDLATGRQLGESIHAASHFVAFAPDGKILALTNPGTLPRSQAPTTEQICLWDIAAGKEIRTWTAKPYFISGTFSPDGRTLATASNEWVLKGGAKSEKGKKVIGENTAVIRMWDTATGKELWRSAEHLRAIFSIAFSADGKTLTSAGGYFNDEKGERHGELKIWDSVTGKELQSLPGLADRVDCVRFSADGNYLASIGPDGPIILWDLKAMNGPRRVWETADNGSGLAFAPDSRRLAWCTRQTIRMIDVPPRKNANELVGHTGTASFVAFTPDGKTVVSAGETVRVWDAATGEHLRASRARFKEFSGAALSPDGKALITASRGGTTVWDLASMNALRSISTPWDRDVHEVKAVLARLANRPAKP